VTFTFAYVTYSTLHSKCTCHRFIHFLGFKLMNLGLLAPCSTVWATGM